GVDVHMGSVRGLERGVLSRGGSTESPTGVAAWVASARAAAPDGASEGGAEDLPLPGADPRPLPGDEERWGAKEVKNSVSPVASTAACETMTAVCLPVP